MSLCLPNLPWPVGSIEDNSQYNHLRIGCMEARKLFGRWLQERLTGKAASIAGGSHCGKWV